MMMTLAMAYAVITHATSLSVAPRLPRISVSATLTMVVWTISKSAHMTAVMVMITRRNPYSTKSSPFCMDDDIVFCFVRGYRQFSVGREQFAESRLCMHIFTFSTPITIGVKSSNFQMLSGLSIH